MSILIYKYYDLLKSLSVQNLSVTSGPNITEIPLLLGCLPFISDGSDHKQSHIIPSSPGSLNRLVFLISSNLIPSFENNPPWVTNTFLFIQ